MELIRKRVTETQVGPPRTHGPLTIVPLVGNDRSTRDYLTLDEALSAGHAKITEVNSAGDIPRLKFINKGDLPVFAMEGEELVGARQNRALNLSVLIGAHTSVTIPVSCVEASRWDYTSRDFRTSSGLLFCSSRAANASDVTNSSRFGRRSTNQAGVWGRLGRVAQELGVGHYGAALSDILDAANPLIQEYVEALPSVDDQVGAVFAVSGRVVGMDLFDCPSTYDALRPKLIASYALEALCAPYPGRTERVTDDAREFVRDVCNAEGASYEGVATGADIRLEGEGLTGGGLAYEDRLIHLSAFHLPGARQTVHAPIGACPVEPPASRPDRDEELMPV